MRFLPEPAFTHGALSRRSGTAILLCNLGSPDEPKTASVRRYLAEFLSDRRVVEIPRALWLPLLHGVILRTRPAASARRYAGIWMPEGSPLKVWTDRQAKLLAGYLGERGHAVEVLPAMRYGSPSIAHQLDALKRSGVSRVLVLPLYPQYSGTTTASVFDAACAWAGRTRFIPELRFVNHFHDDPDYIDALAARVREHWRVNGRGNMLVMSFHGIPQRTLALGDPYHCECLKTGRLLKERLGLSEHETRLTFQSRFGRAEWLQPYTEPTLRELAQTGHERVDVICPGFVSDCLETLEEIALEARRAFEEAGGKEFHYVPALNDQHDWIKTLVSLSLRHLEGWPTAAPGEAARTAAAQRHHRARAAGAEDPGS